MDFGLARVVAMDLTPKLLEFTRAVREAYKDSGILTAAWVALGGVAFNLFSNTLDQQIAKTKREIADLKATGGAGITLPGIKPGTYGYEKEIAALEKKLKEYETQRDAAAKSQAEQSRKRREEEEKIKKAQQDASAELRKNLALQGEKEKAARQAASEEAARLTRGEQAIVGMERERDLYDEVSRVARTRWEIEKGTLRDLTAGHQARLMEIAAQLDALDALRDAEKELETDRDAAMNRANERMRQVGDLLKSIQTPQEKYNEEMERLRELLNDNAITFDVFEKAASKAEEAMKAATDTGKDQFEELKDAIDGWGKDSAKAIADFAVKGAGSFSDMAESIISDILQMMIYQNITKGLFEGMGTGVSSLFSGLFGGGRAGGGSVSPGKMYEVNETGLPELLNVGNRQFLMMSNRAGHVATVSSSGDSGPAGGGGGGVNVTVINNAGAEISTQTKQGAGGMDIEVIVDQMVSKKLSQFGSKSNKAVRQSFGAKPILTTR